MLTYHRTCDIIKKLSLKTGNKNFISSLRPEKINFKNLKIRVDKENKIWYNNQVAWNGDEIKTRMDLENWTTLKLKK